eukprot:5314953-Karenia_brevis.AAC.1
MHMHRTRHGPNCSSTDLEVRNFLHAPSIECRLQRKRLLYVGKLCREGPASLLALLQARVGRDKSQLLPWVRQIVQDMRDLKTFHARKLDELPDPEEAPTQWFHIMTSYP